MINAKIVQPTSQKNYRYDTIKRGACSASPVIRNTQWDMELDCKPDFMQSMKRIYAWYEQAIIDRPPIRFSAHNAEYDNISEDRFRWGNLRDRWFDVEYQVESFIKSLQNRKFYAETFPVFWPNLGPGVYSAFYGTELEFGEITSWAKHFLKDGDDINTLNLHHNSIYFRKLHDLTMYALDRCSSKFMVGFTDLHPGMDCVADWRGSENLCMDMITDPIFVKALGRKSVQDFHEIYDHFDILLKSHKQLSVNWMGIPSFGRLHIPSCDFATLISSGLFIEFCLPLIEREMTGMTHNIFHLDGKGVARHLDSLLQLPQIHAIQWVQGIGLDAPIMQWVDLIKKIQHAGKSVVVSLGLDELEDFIDAMNPEGLLLCIEAQECLQPQIIKRVEQW